MFEIETNIFAILAIILLLSVVFIKFQKSRKFISGISSIGIISISVFLILHDVLHLGLENYQFLYHLISFSLDEIRLISLFMLKFNQATTLFLTSYAPVIIETIIFMMYYSFSQAFFVINFKFMNKKKFDAVVTSKESKDDFDVITYSNDFIKIQTFTTLILTLNC